MTQALLTALALLWAGCATSMQLTLDPVGPMSGDPLPEKLSSRQGFLQVFNQRRQYDDAGIAYECFTPYIICTTSGAKLQSVANRVGPMDQKPMTVPLAEGRYVVYAHAEGYGRVQIPVDVHAGQLTQVYLTYEGMRDHSTLPDSAWVRLPNGTIVGRRAPPPASTSP